MGVLGIMSLSDSITMDMVSSAVRPMSTLCSRSIVECPGTCSYSMLFAICLCFLLCYSKSSSYYLLCHLLLLVAFTICYLLCAIRKNECDLLSACRLFLSSAICFAICFTFLPMAIPMCKSLRSLKIDPSSSHVLRSWRRR
jgi:hypothetical protein